MGQTEKKGALSPLPFFHLTDPFLLFGRGRNPNFQVSNQSPPAGLFFAPVGEIQEVLPPTSPMNGRSYSPFNTSLLPLGPLERKGEDEEDPREEEERERSGEEKRVES